MNPQLFLLKKKGAYLLKVRFSDHQCAWKVKEGQVLEKEKLNNAVIPPDCSQVIFFLLITQWC